MPNALEFLQGAFRGNGPSGEEVRWEDLEAALWEVASSPPTPEGEQLLLDIIRFEGRIRLSPTSELPHSLSPEDMLKSLAIQALTRWTALTYLLEIRRTRAVATSPMLTAVARAVAKEILQTKKRTTAVDNVETISSSATPPNGNQPDVWGRDAQGVQVRQEDAQPPWVRIRAVARDRGMTFLPDQRIRRRSREYQPDSPLCGVTN